MGADNIFGETNFNPDVEGEEPNFTFEDGFLIYSKKYLIKRGECCGEGCINCPYSPPFIKGNKELIS